MNLSELKTFLAIVDTGSLVRASEILHVTQSTVTARLKSLEDELGQTLLVRNKSGAILTPAGLRLRRYADTINDLWTQARQETALPDGLSSVCNIACETDLWTGLGAVFFDYLRQSFPNVAISVWRGSQSDVAHWMASGKSDLAFSYVATANARQSPQVLGRDALVLVSSAPDSPMRFDPGYVFVEAGEDFGRDHAVAYADANIARLSFGTADLGLAHLLAHGGSAYLPRRIARPHLEAGRLFAIADAPVFEREAFLITNTAARSAWTWFERSVAHLRDQNTL